MTDPAPLLIIAASGSAAVALATLAALRGWNQWLELKRLQAASGARPTGGRSELAELRKRVRKLEAIASGIEL
jgi:hypothetical protein